MRFKKPVALLLSVCLGVMTAASVQADTTEERIESVRSEKAGTESSLAAAEARIDALESLQGDLEAYLTELNAQYEELTGSLEDLTNQAAKKEEQLNQVKLELREAKRQEAEQYAAMKLRISYMYENGQCSYLAALLSADSFTDFLDRAENIMMISQYDRDMLKKYERTKEKVAEKKARVQEEQQEIERLRQECALKREEIEQLEDSTRDEIAAYQQQIEDKQSEASSLLELVNSQSAELDSLVAQLEAEQEAERKAQEEMQRRAEAEAEAAREAQEQAAEEEQQAESAEDAGDPQEDAMQEEVPEENDAEESSGGEPASQEASSGGTYLGNFKLTAYCNCAQCCGTAGNYTASGTWPTPGRTVAMAGVPFGTKLLINGNVYTVEDLGTPYGHVDIYCGSHSEALSFGLQYADVYQVN